MKKICFTPAQFDHKMRHEHLHHKRINEHIQILFFSFIPKEFEIYFLKTSSSKILLDHYSPYPLNGYHALMA